MKIDLSTEERRVLLRLIKDELDSAKYPLAPELKVLRDLADKLRRGESEGARLMLGVSNAAHNIAALSAPTCPRC